MSEEALRDDFPTCPVDGSALDPTEDGSRHCCGTCKGVQISEPSVIALLGEIVEEKAPKTLVFEPPKEAEPIRTCPHCATQMSKHVLYTIQIDRCEAHGLWFDGEELARVLERASVEGMRAKKIKDVIVGSVVSVAYIGFVLAQLLYR